MPNYYDQVSAPRIDLNGQEQFDPAVGERPETEYSNREIPVRFIPATQLLRPAGTSPGLLPDGGLNLGAGTSRLSGVGSGGAGSPKGAPKSSTKGKVDGKKNNSNSTKG